MREAQGPPFAALFRDLGIPIDTHVLGDWPCALMGRRVRINGRLIALEDKALFHAMLFGNVYNKTMLW